MREQWIYIERGYVDDLQINKWINTAKAIDRSAFSILVLRDSRTIPQNFLSQRANVTIHSVSFRFHAMTSTLVFLTLTMFYLCAK